MVTSVSLTYFDYPPILMNSSIVAICLKETLSLQSVVVVGKNYLPVTGSGSEIAHLRAETEFSGGETS